MVSLSVIVPTYKRAGALKRNLASIVASGVKADEILIGDDGGDSQTADVYRSFSDQLPIKVLSPEGKGSLAKNIIRLLKSAKGNWILLLHDDDFLVGDHSNFPQSFADECDFFFTDHLIADENGNINYEESDINSKRFGRSALPEGTQQDQQSLIREQKICLDGFYARREILMSHLPDPQIGSVADYFWLFKVFHQSKFRVCYSSKKTFAYTISSIGLTAGGLNIDQLKGYRSLLSGTTDVALKKFLERKISFDSWYAVNASVRQGKRKQAFRILRELHFNYTHSWVHKFLMPLQVLTILSPFRKRR